MKTLEYLNGIASTNVNFTDTRPSGIIFDRTQGKNYAFTETTTSFPLLIGGNILEIINPLVTNVRYRINLGTVDADLSYSGIPFGIVVVKEGTVYTYFNIKTVSEWEAIKQPTVIIDPNFQGTFSYTVTILYNTDTTIDNEFSWSVGIYVPFSQMVSSTTLTSTPRALYGPPTNLVFVSSLFIEGIKILLSTFQVSAFVGKTVRPSMVLQSTATLSCKPRLFTFNDSTLTIDNPLPFANGSFGQYLVVDNSGQYVSSVYRTSLDDYVLGIFDIEDRQQIQSFTNAGSDLDGNGNWLLNRHITGTNNFRLYRKQSQGNPYSLTATLVKQIDFNNAWGLGIGRTISDNYCVIRNVTTAVGKNNYILEIYSIDPSTGFTFLYSKQGTAHQYLNNTFEQRLGERIVISDNYLCLAENVIIGQAPDTHDDIFVYNTANGNFIRKLSNNVDVRDMIIEGNNLIVLTASDLIKWDLITGNLIYAYNLTSFMAVGGRIERYQDRWTAVQIAQFPGTGITFIDDNGKRTSTISITNSDFKIIGTDTLIVGDNGFDGVQGNQGIIYVKKET
jgi:hypothetical protein